MNLGELIDTLASYPPDLELPVGLGNPHSYRGDYECVAFEPKYNISVGLSLINARSALGETFTGYKGGEYFMSEDTKCYIAEWGSTGKAIVGIGISIFTSDED